MKRKRDVRAYIRRYRAVALLSLFVLVGIFFMQPQPTKPANATTPTPAQIVQANVLDQGVHITWQPSQAGSHPIRSYVVERGNQRSGFEQIARVEAWSSNYLDADGKAGDTYRIVTEDDQSRSVRATVSDSVVAAPVKPGATVVMSSYSPQVLGVSGTNAETKVTTEQVAQLGRDLSRGFTTLDETLGQDVSLVPEQLTTLQLLQRQVSTLWPRLSPTQKSILIQVCADNLPVFQTNLHRMPEAHQFDGMLVLAGCNALSEASQ